MRRSLVILLLVSLAATATAQVPPRSISTAKDEIDDEFLAYIHGLLVHDASLRADGETLLGMFPEFDPERPTPFHDIRLFTRLRVGGRPLLTITFGVPLDWEVPVDIFGHHPVKLLGSRIISFEETRPRPGTLAGLDESTDVARIFLFSRVSGFLRVDFAPWLDFVTGPLLEDVEVTLIALVRYQDRWYALLGGHSPELRPMVGVLDMRITRFMVSPPRELVRMAHELVERGL